MTNSTAVDMNARPRTVRDVNRALEAKGYPERLVRGAGYFYFTGGDAQRWQEAGVYGVGSVLSAFTVGEWVREREQRQAEWEAGQ